MATSPASQSPKLATATQTVGEQIESNKALYRRFVDAAVNKVGVLDEQIIHQNFRFNLSNGVEAGGEDVSASGVQMLRDHFAAEEAAFPDHKMVIDDLIAEGDRVVARQTLRSGPHSGVPYHIFTPAMKGKSIIVEEIVIARIEDGRLVEMWFQMDFAGMAQQVGMEFAEISS